MSRRRRRRRRAAELGPLNVEITDDEILAALSWPGPPPGRWRVQEGLAEARGDTAHVDELLEALERALWVGA